MPDYDPQFGDKLRAIEAALPPLDPIVRRGTPIAEWPALTPLQRMLATKCLGNSAGRKRIAGAAALMQRHGLTWIQLSAAVFPLNHPMADSIEQRIRSLQRSDDESSSDVIQRRIDGDVRPRGRPS